MYKRVEYFSKSFFEKWKLDIFKNVQNGKVKKSFEKRPLKSDLLA